MKKFSYVLLISIILVLVGCSDDDGDTSTGGDSANVTENGDAITTNEGGLLLVEVEDQATAGSVINLRYVSRDAEGLDQPGTLFWDDNTSSRIRGSASINHIYREPGTYRIAIQPDGGERVVVGSVVVIPADDFLRLVGDWRATFDLVSDSGFSFRIDADRSIHLRGVPGSMDCQGRITSFELESDGVFGVSAETGGCGAFIVDYNTSSDIITGVLVIAFQKPEDAFTARRR